MRTPDGIIIVKVVPGDFDKFRFLDPYDSLDLGALPRSFVLGALDDGSYGRKNYPAGLLVASMTEIAITIEWMATDPVYRNLEIADAFVDAVFRVAKETGIPEAEARIRLGVGMYEEYFINGFCEREVKDRGEYRLPWADVLNLGKLPEEDGWENIYPVNDWTDEESSALYEYLSKPSHVFSLLSEIPAKEELNPYLSAAWIEDGEVTGALLFVSIGHNHYPLVIAGKSDYEMKALIRSAVLKAKALRLLDDNLIIRCSSARTRSMVRDILGDNGFVPARRLVARVEDYEF